MPPRAPSGTNAQTPWCSSKGAHQCTRPVVLFGRAILSTVPGDDDGRYVDMSIVSLTHLTVQVGLIVREIVRRFIASLGVALGGSGGSVPAAAS